jgi:hypothetical protein
MVEQVLAATQAAPDAPTTDVDHGVPLLSSAH